MSNDIQFRIIWTVVIDLYAEYKSNVNTWRQNSNIDEKIFKLQQKWDVLDEIVLVVYNWLKVLYP